MMPIDIILTTMLICASVLKYHQHELYPLPVYRLYLLLDPTTATARGPPSASIRGMQVAPIPTAVAAARTVTMGTTTIN